MASGPIPLKVLVVDDEANIARTLKLSLKDLGCAAESASSVAAAIERVRDPAAAPFDLVLTDFRMEQSTGLDLILELRRLAPTLPVVVMTAYASFANAVDVIQAGAFDYLAKPFTNEQLGHLLHKVRTVVQLRRENEELRRARHRRDYFNGFTSPAVRRTEEFARKIAPTEGSVLLLGESGTGKSELAKWIHEWSPRARGPFVTVQCTTLTESLLESELFGHVKGAFTGAISDRNGKLVAAHRGTLFLDEIGELSPSGQTKLLQFLQDRVFQRVGSNEEITVDVRVIAATNRDLREAVDAGEFREDLYYRLNVLECTLVPLRYRREDLPVLIKKLHPGELSPPVLARLLAYDWPGNVRELRNALERIAMLSAGRAATESDLPDAILRPKPADPADPNEPFPTIEEMERRHIELAMQRESNLERVAKMLGITTVTLWRKRKQYGLN